MTPGTPVGRFTRTLRNFGSQIHQLVRELFHHFAADIIKVLLASGAGLVCQAVALLALFAYVRALENNAQLFGLASRGSPGLFALIAAATLLLLVGYSLLEYRAKIAILSICRRYQNQGTEEAIALSSALPQWFAPSETCHISIRHLRQLLSVDVNDRSRVAHVLLSAIIPAARLLLCSLVLIYLNPEFSAVILVAVGLPVVGLYSVGRKVADSITVRETGSVPVFLQQLQLLQESWRQGAPLEGGQITWEATLGQSDSRYRQYFRRGRAKALGDFLINSANTVGILVLVIALGFWILQEQQGNWSHWLTYLVVLRYFLASLRNVAQLMVTSTRFLRQAKRFSDFVTAAQLAVHAPNPAAVPCPEHLMAAYKGSGNKEGDSDDADEDLSDG